PAKVQRILAQRLPNPAAQAKVRAQVRDLRPDVPTDLVGKPVKEQLQLLSTARLERRKADRQTADLARRGGLNLAGMGGNAAGVWEQRLEDAAAYDRWGGDDALRRHGKDPARMTFQEKIREFGQAFVHDERNERDCQDMLRQYPSLERRENFLNNAA